MFTAILASGIVTLAILSPALAQGPNCGRSYKIQPGDTCDGISATQSVSTFQLAHDNPGLDCAKLESGKTICLGIKGQDCTATKVITSGQTCTDVASSANISLQTLHANNPNLNADCSNTYPGEVLCVAPTAIGY